MDKPSKKNFYYYNRNLQPNARKLRSQMTKSEACLWKFVLRANQMLGYQFRRQRPVLDYIVDFMCKELFLIIEVDGITHEGLEAHVRDQERDHKLSEAGFTVLRFSSWEVLNRIDLVSAIIVEWINKNAKVKPTERVRSKRGN